MSAMLKELRRALGFHEVEVAQKAGWSPARQVAIEAGDELLDHEADTLGAILGVDLDAVLGSGLTGPRPLGALLKGSARALDAETRFGLAEAATVAREIRQLAERLELPTGLETFRRFTGNPRYSHPRHGIADQLAAAVRKDLGLSPRDPIPSVTSDLLGRLHVRLLWLAMPPQIDAVAMASDETGAVVVANPKGAHMQTGVGRRIALAHELCHILYDRVEMPKFTKACRIEQGVIGRERDRFELVERRARAFAPALLAPKPAVQAFWASHPDVPDVERVWLIMDRFGIGYSAARAHLGNCGVTVVEDSGLRSARQPTSRWDAADAIPSGLPRDSRSLRATHLAALAEMAVDRRLISKRRANELRRGPLHEAEAWSPDSDAKPPVTTSSVASSLA